tara:strand:+ start:1552 stop:1881 length:330 start_codon:yes stop_codon:yes gene_type:complete
MGKASRDKGYRTENNVRKYAEIHGLKAYRVPLSGGGSIKGDVVFNNGIDELVSEVKCRGNGFKNIYKWLEGNDLLILKADNKEFLAVIDLKDFFNYFGNQQKKRSDDVS